MDETFKTVLGTYQGVSIFTDKKEYSARAYKSKQRLWLDKKGFFLLKKDKDIFYWIICDYVPYEETT